MSASAGNMDAMIRVHTCQACGHEFDQAGRGRWRKYCYECVPPGSGAAAMRAWRAVNQERVHEYNQSRRVGVRSYYCTECRRPFAATRSDQIRCPTCQALHERARKR